MIATILMVAITVVLAAVLYVMVLYIINPSVPPSNPIGLTPSETGKNWTLLVSSAPSGLDLGSVFLTMKDRDGLVKQPMNSVPLSELTEQHWQTYKVYYQKAQNDDTTVTVGSSLLIYKEAYPSGYQYVLSNEMAILGNGAL